MVPRIELALGDTRVDSRGDKGAAGKRKANLEEVRSVISRVDEVVLVRFKELAGGADRGCV